jgi:hypothetical protein
MQDRVDNCQTAIQLNEGQFVVQRPIHKRRSCYRLHEQSCSSVPFRCLSILIFALFIAVTFAFLCQWPETIEFLKGIAIFLN